MRWVLLICLLLAACETEPKPQPPAIVEVDTDEVSAPATIEELAWTGPALKLALPDKILAMRMEKAEPVGTLSTDGGEAIPLDGFGLNLCQTGWAFQGFSRPSGEYKSTPVFLISKAEIPLGQKFKYSNPAITNSFLEFDMTAWSSSKVKGTIRLLDQKNPEKELLVFKVDTAPISIAATPGYGPQGCFTTGYYRVADTQGPVTAVWDGKNLFYVSMRLDETHAVSMEFSLRAYQRKSDNLLQVDLARVFAEPMKFPMRVYLETRKDNTDLEGDLTHEIVRLPVTAGKLRAAFLSQSPEGPIRLDLKGVAMPAEFGAWSSKTLDFRAEALFVSDLKGRRVPVPAPPNWDLSIEAAAKTTQMKTQTD